VWNEARNYFPLINVIQIRLLFWLGIVPCVHSEVSEPYEQGESPQDARSVVLPVVALLWSRCALMVSLPALTPVACPRPHIYTDASVIGLSPETLLATNRFVCEVCGAGP
jgi:hypothetical protein